MGRSRVGRNKGASAICDRTGVRYPMSEMVKEPGTGYLVHRSVSDGMWSAVSHPLNNLGRYLKNKQGDPFPVQNARPRPSTETASAIINHTGSVRAGGKAYIATVPFQFKTAGTANITASASLLVSIDPFEEFLASVNVTGTGSVVSTGTSNLLGVPSGIQGTTTVSSTATKQTFGNSNINGETSLTITGTGSFLGASTMDCVATFTFSEVWEEEGNNSGDLNSWFQPCPAELGENRVGIIEQNDIFAIDYSDPNWSVTGSSLSHGYSGVGPVASCKISYSADDSSDQSMATIGVVSGSFRLRLYEFGGSSWSLLGSELSISIGSGSQILMCYLGPNRIAFYDGVSLRTYTYSGGTWSQTGSTLTLTNVIADIVEIDTDLIALADLTNGDLKAYSWDGSTWSQVGTALSLPSGTLTNSKIGFLEANKIYLMKQDSGGDQLVVYSYADAGPSSPPFTLETQTAGFSFSVDAQTTYLSQNRMFICGDGQGQTRVYNPPT